MRNFWEKWDIKEDLADGRRGSDSPFQIFSEKKNCAVFEDLETNLRLLGRKCNGDNFDG